MALRFGDGYTIWSGAVDISDDFESAVESNACAKHLGGLGGFGAKKASEQVHNAGQEARSLCVAEVLEIDYVAFWLLG